MDLASGIEDQSHETASVQAAESCFFKVVTSIQKKTEMTAEQLSRIAHHCNLTCLVGCVREINLYLEMPHIVFFFSSRAI